MYQYSTKTATYTLTVDKKVINIPAQNVSLTYDGTEKIPSFSNYDEDVMNLSVTARTNAGDYTATFSLINTRNCKWSDETTSNKNVSWSIAKASSSVSLYTNSAKTEWEKTVTVGDTVQLYGTSRGSTSISYTSEDTTIATVSSTGLVTTQAAGQVRIYVNLAETTNYLSASDYVTITVQAQKISVPKPTQSGTLRYTGSSISPSWTNYDSTIMSIGGVTSRTNPGTYDATFTITNSDYEFSDGTTSCTVQWTLSKGLSSIAVYTDSGKSTWQATVSVGNTVQIYKTSSGSTSLTYSSNDTSIASVSSTGVITANAVGQVRVYANLAETTYYTSASDYVLITVEKAKTNVSKPSQSGTLKYDGSTKYPSWTDYDTSIMSISGTTSGVNPGSYTANFTITNSDYQFSDGTTSCSISWSISKGSSSIAVYTNSGKTTWQATVNVGDTVQIYKTSSGSTSISYSSNDTSIATVNSSGLITAKAVGTVNVYGRLAETTYYSSASDYVRITVVEPKTSVAKPSQSGSLTYDATTKYPSWTGYDSSIMSISGTTSGVNAGSYTATFTITNSSYQFSDGTTSCSVSWSIGKATSSIRVYTNSGKTSWQATVNIGDTVQIYKTSSGSTSISYSSRDTSIATVNSSGLITAKAVGTVYIDATLAETSNYTGDSDYVKITVEQAKTSVAKPTQSNTLTYNGSTKYPSWTGYNSSIMSISGTTSAINAGSYSATFTITNSSYQFSDGTTSCSVSWTIGVAQIDYDCDDCDVEYDGTNHTISVKVNTPSSGYTIKYGTSYGTYNLSSPPNYKEPGEYPIYYEITATNYQTVRDYNYVDIRRRTTAYPTQAGSETYSGSTKTPSWDNYNTSFMSISGTTSGVNAGTYNVTFTITDSLHKFANGTTTYNTTWKINPQALSAYPRFKGGITYNGTEHNVAHTTSGMTNYNSWYDSNRNIMQIGGTFYGTEPGTYNVYFTIIDSNYCFPNGSTIYNTTWKIQKITQSFQIAKSGGSGQTSLSYSLSGSSSSTSTITVKSNTSCVPISYNIDSDTASMINSVTIEGHSVNSKIKINHRYPSTTGQGTKSATISFTTPETTYYTSATCYVYYSLTYSSAALNVDKVYTFASLDSFKDMVDISYVPKTMLSEYYNNQYLKANNTKDKEIALLPIEEVVFVSNGIKQHYI